MPDPQYLFGLIGKKLGHSFSARYFNEKFERLGLDARYELFELPDINELPRLLERPNLVGLNVTIPFKQAVIPNLDCLAESARKVGAVNTIAQTTDGWVGHNTDMPAFRQSLLNFCLEEDHAIPDYALILGTGGSSKAVKAALEELGVRYRFVSRNASPDAQAYSGLRVEDLNAADLIINTTPLGMHPDVDSKPPIPYQWVRPGTLAFDLVYNPGETAFMKAMTTRGCPVRNGMEMLHLQAEGAWEIWKEAVRSNKAL